VAGQLSNGAAAASVYRRLLGAEAGAGPVLVSEPDPSAARTRGRLTRSRRPPRVTDPASVPCRSPARSGLCLVVHRGLPLGRLLARDRHSQVPRRPGHPLRGSGGWTLPRYGDQA